MTTDDHAGTRTGAQAGLVSRDPSTRLRAALVAGTSPAAEHVEVLVARCAVEPDFSVRELLTWALVRHDVEVVLPLLLAELRAEGAQARSQALHTLSKIGDRRAWPAVTVELLRDGDDEVARAAWRAAVVLVPDGAAGGLADVLVSQLGRGGRDVRLSLSRALVALGPAAESALDRAAAHADDEVRVHARAVQRLVQDPDEGFDSSVAEARRVVALPGAPVDEG